MCFLSGKPLDDEEKQKNGEKQKYFEEGRQVCDAHPGFLAFQVELDVVLHL